MKAHLTDVLARKAELPTRGYSLIWDDEALGLGLQVTARGAKSFVVSYTTSSGQQRRQTIGRYPALSVTAARKRATEIRGLVYQGHDPLAERQAARFEGKQKDTSPTLADLRTRYLTEYVDVRRTREGRTNERIYWRTIIEHLRGDTPLHRLSHEAIQRLHADLSNRPIRANRVVTSLSTALNRAVKWEWISTNPAAGIQRNPENPRERFLSPDEIHRFNLAVDSQRERTSALLIRFLLLTGARSGETKKAKWSDIDLSNSCWMKPAATTKTKRTHRLPLSVEAMAVLLELRELSKGDWVFPGMNGGHLTDVKRTWKSIRADAELNNITLHDLRHSHASILVNAGVNLAVISKALGHAQISTTMRYAHLKDETLKSAIAQVGALAGPKNSKPKPTEQ